MSPFLLYVILPLTIAIAAIILRFWLRASGLAGVQVTDGELLQRIRALATQADVKLRGLYIAPEGPSGNLTTLATSNRSVLVSGRLLRELPRPEVEALITRQLAHLHFRHANRLALLACVFVAVAFFRFTRFADADQLARQSGLLNAGALVFFLVAALWSLLRQRAEFEQKADLFAARICGQQVLISALTKLERLSGFGESETAPHAIGRTPLDKRITAIRAKSTWQPDYSQAPAPPAAGTFSVTGLQSGPLVTPY